MQLNFGDGGSKIFEYLNGHLEIEDLRLTRENGRAWLKVIKIVDIAISKIRKLQKLTLKRSSYDLRTRILVLSSPEMQTSEAYTKSINPKKIFDKEYLTNPFRWVVERTRIHFQIFLEQFALATALSRRLGDEVPHVSAIRGGTAVGKSYYLNKKFSHALDANGELSGCLNPDVIKASLKKLAFNRLVNAQVHREGTALFALLQKAIIEHPAHLKIMTDIRLISIANLQSSLLRPAIVRNGVAQLMDKDGILETSIVRVLVRDPYGKDPCVCLSAVVNGYVQLRENRPRLLESIAIDPIVENYELYFTDTRGEEILAARKWKNQFKILNGDAFKECIRKPSDREIHQSLKRIITPKYIDQAIAHKVIHPQQKELLERWKGKTLAHAMGRHVRGNDLCDEEAIDFSSIRYLSVCKRSRHSMHFFGAIEEGNLQDLESMFNRIDDVNIRPIWDGMNAAAIAGKTQVINFLFTRGVNIIPPETEKFRFGRWENLLNHLGIYMELLTTMGYAINHRHISVVQTLVENGEKIEDIYPFEKIISPLDLYFLDYKSKGPNLPLLKLIISTLSKNNLPHLSKPHKETIFEIAVHANIEEMKLLMEAGFDIKTTSGKDNVLDLVVMHAEIANLVKPNLETIEKVMFLLEHGASLLKLKRYNQGNLLHCVSHPKLIQALCQAGVDIFQETTVKCEGERSKYSKCRGLHTFRPIDIASDQETIDILCSFGEDRSNASLLKETKAHEEALARVENHELNLFSERPKRWLLKAMERHDTSAFIALLGEGVDVNQVINMEEGWTCLHYLFSKLEYISYRSEYGLYENGTESDRWYNGIASNNTILMINLLIKQGAKPLKDEKGNTPLMYLKSDTFSRWIIDLYIDFEVDFYGFDRLEHLKKISTRKKYEPFRFTRYY